MSDVILAGMKRTLRMLESAVGQLNEQVEELRNAIAYYEKLDVPQKAVTRAAVPGQVCESALEILHEEGGPLHYREIYHRLRMRGIVVNGHDPARNLIAHMSGDWRFQNVGPAVWSLMPRVANELEQENRRLRARLDVLERERQEMQDTRKEGE